MIRFLVAFLQPTGKSLEWTTSEGRTFQISGHRGMIGCWERLFPANDHPYRRQLGLEEAQQQFEAADEFVLYALQQEEAGAERLNREQVLDRIEQMLPGSVRRK